MKKSYEKTFHILNLVIVVVCVSIINMLPFFLVESLFWKAYSPYQLLGMFDISLIIDTYLVFSLFFQKTRSFMIALCLKCIWFYYIFQEPMIESLQWCALLSLSIVFLMHYIQEGYAKIRHV